MGEVFSGMRNYPQRKSESSREPLEHFMEEAAWMLGGLGEEGLNLK